MKDFLLICDKNCATYKEVFPLFKQGIVSFGSPVKEYEGTDRKFGNHSWITTFSVPNKKKLVLTAAYDPALYPKYDNYDAIEVTRIKNIPYDYDGVMGVPITILDYDLDNVEIVDMSTMSGVNANYWTYVDGKPHYSRVFIKKNFELEGIWNDKREEDNFIVKGTPTYLDEKHKSFQGPVIDGKAKYARVLIKKNFELVDCKEPALTMDDIAALGITEYPSRQITHNGKKCQKTYHRIMIKKNFEVLWIASGHSKNTMPKDIANSLSADFEMKSKGGTGNGYAILNGNQLYHRILIRKKQDI